MVLAKFLVGAAAVSPEPDVLSPLSCLEISSSAFRFSGYYGDSALSSAHQSPRQLHCCGRSDSFSDVISDLAAIDAHALDDLILCSKTTPAVR